MRDKNGENYVYLRAQTQRTVELDELTKYAAEHYAGRLSNFEIMQAIDAVQASILDYIKGGNQVSLGELGTFYPHITSNCIPESEFQKTGLKPARDIKNVCVKWKAKGLFKNLLAHDKIDFKIRSHVETRKAMLKQGPTMPEE